jgi:sugar O-acyltransferase (sialic acid O-acetyltransferase NeuD family)
VGEHVSELLLIAASGLGREVLVSVRSSGQYDIVGFLDDNEELFGIEVDGAPVLGPINDATRYKHAFVLVCIGSSRARKAVVDRLTEMGISATRYATVIDSSVRKPEESRVGQGSILLQNVTLTASVTLGAHVVAMPGVTFTHDDDVADFATFDAGASLGGGVRVGRAAHLGMNSSIREGTTIGAYATIGMGAAVLSNVSEGETWVGVPARPIDRGQFREDGAGTVSIASGREGWPTDVG